MEILQTMRAECSSELLQIDRKSEKTKTSKFFDGFLFLLSSLVTGSSFMSTSSLVLEGLTINPEIGNIPV